MEQSSSGSTNSDDRPIKDSPSGRNGDARAIDPNDSANQRMIADRLLAALASGNLDNLAQARKAFIKEPPVETPKQRPPKKPTLVKTASPKPTNVVAFEPPADLEAQLERRSAPRAFEESFVDVDEFRKEEEELKHAEAELERRRAEVHAARRKAEEEAKRRAFEEARRQLESAARRRAEEARLAELQRLREEAQAAAQQRALTARELSATLDLLRTGEQEELKRIEHIETQIREQEDVCRRLQSDAEQHSERAHWLAEEIHRLKKAEQDQLNIVEATE